MTDAAHRADQWPRVGLGAELMAQAGHQQVDAAAGNRLQSTSTSNTSSASSSSSSSDAASVTLTAFIDLVMKQYGQTAAASAATHDASISLTA